MIISVTITSLRPTEAIHSFKAGQNRKFDNSDIHKKITFFYCSTIYKILSKMKDEEFLSLLQTDNSEELAKNINNEEDANIMIGCDIKSAPSQLKDGPPLISCAAFFNAIKCFNLLLERGARLTEVDEESVTTLQFAIMSGSKEIISLIFKNKDKAETNFIGFYTLRKGYKDMFFWLVDQNFVDLNEIDFTKSTYAHVAASIGDVDSLKRIVENSKININAKNYIGRTALHEACGEGHVDAVKYLLSLKDIDAAVLDNFERPPLYYAHLQENWEIVKLFFGGDFNKIHDDCGQTSLQIACRKGNANLVRLMLEIPEVDVNLKNPKYGLAAIHFAARFDEYDVMQALLESGKCDVNIQDNAGKTALHYANEAKSTDIITLLLKNKANPNIKDNEGKLPLDDIKNFNPNTSLPKQQ